MHYFSLHTSDGRHIGFFIMLPDDENTENAQSGRFAVKLQSEETPPDSPAVRTLLQWQNNAEQALYWAVEKDHVALFDEQGPLGRIRNEWLTIGGETLLINDITGIM